MNQEDQNNPLYGLELDDLLTELVEFYGWDILAAELRFDCFSSNGGIEECLKFLSSTAWAREKLEAFYLYRFKGLPRPYDDQYKLPPRERSFAAGTVTQAPNIPAAEDDKSKAVAKGKQNFEPCHKSPCDRRYYSPKRKT
ncbi:VF530 family DNA-binding protein [Psychromonas aquimarina]|uniref:VF530 family DNA-binding protein n=1 Tax=Psychromonas aquimarina TaxID=444919 RepID=UPI0003FE40F1|nr:VF530 family DNA-binding protein [Psychromonas aquimarina]